MDFQPIEGISLAHTQCTWDSLWIHFDPGQDKEVPKDSGVSKYKRDVVRVVVDFPQYKDPFNDYILKLEMGSPLICTSLQQCWLYSKIYSQNE